MADYSAISAHLKTVVESVSGVGNVYDRLRIVNGPEKTESDIETLFVSDGVQRWAFITRTGWEVRDGDVNREIRAHAMEVHLFEGFQDDDSSDKTLQDRADLVADAIENDANSTFGAFVIIEGVTAEFDHVRTHPNDVLCSHAVLRVQVEHYADC